MALMGYCGRLKGFDRDGGGGGGKATSTLENERKRRRRREKESRANLYDNMAPYVCRGVVAVVMARLHLR